MILPDCDLGLSYRDRIVRHLLSTVLLLLPHLSLPARVAMAPEDATTVLGQNVDTHEDESDEQADSKDHS